MHFDDADLVAVGVEVVDGLFGGLAYGAHGNDDAVGVGGAVVVEQTIFAAGDDRNLVHVFFNDFGHLGVGGVASFAVLEEDVAVFSEAACLGVFGAEAAAAELGERFAVEQGSDFVLVNDFDFLDFVAGAETVEEVDKGNRTLDRGEVGYTRQVHYFLNGTFGKHGEAGLANRHYVLVVTEDAQCMAGDGACRHVEHARKHFAGDFVHVGNHQQEALRCGESVGEHAVHQRAVNGAGSAAFALHFLNQNRLAENVLAAVGCPFVNELCHGRGRCDGVNCGYF